MVCGNMPPSPPAALAVCFSCVGHFSLGGLTSLGALCPTCLKCGPRVVSDVKSRLVFFSFLLKQHLTNPELRVQN